MQYYECKCGALRSWASSPPARCRVCLRCDTTLALDPDSHQPPLPHDFMTQYDQNTGVPYLYCRRCGEVKKKESPALAQPGASAPTATDAPASERGGVTKG